VAELVVARPIRDEGPAYFNLETAAGQGGFNSNKDEILLVQFMLRSLQQDDHTNRVSDATHAPEDAGNRGCGGDPEHPGAPGRKQEHGERRSRGRTGKTSPQARRSGHQLRDSLVRPRSLGTHFYACVTPGVRGSAAGCKLSVQVFDQLPGGTQAFVTF
jgi:hypothetical protein